MTLKFVLVSIILLAYLVMSFFVLQAYTDENINWWTETFCTKGEIVEGVIFDNCINDSGTYRASLSGEYCYNNHTSSCVPYWHLVPISEGERT